MSCRATTLARLSETRVRLVPSGWIDALGVYLSRSGYLTIPGVTFPHLAGDST
jgi:hypothetical protein